MVGRTETFMKKDKKELFRAIKFAIISSSAGIIDAGSFLLLNAFVFGEEHVEISQIISLALSVIWSFTINRKITFKAADNIVKSMILVALFYIVFTPASAFFMKWSVSVGCNEILAKGISMVANLWLEFFYLRFVVFRNTCDTAVKSEKKNEK